MQTTMQARTASGGTEASSAQRRTMPEIGIAFWLIFKGFEPTAVATGTRPHADPITAGEAPVAVAT